MAGDAHNLSLLCVLKKILDGPFSLEGKVPSKKWGFRGRSYRDGIIGSMEKPLRYLQEVLYTIIAWPQRLQNKINDDRQDRQ